MPPKMAKSPNPLWTLLGTSMGGQPPIAPRPMVKFHISVVFESYGAVHTTFTTKTMVWMGLEQMVERARYFGPTGPGCGDMRNLGQKS